MIITAPARPPTRAYPCVCRARSITRAQRSRAVRALVVAPVEPRGQVEPPVIRQRGVPPLDTTDPVRKQADLDVVSDPAVHDLETP